MRKENRDECHRENPGSQIDSGVLLFYNKDNKKEDEVKMKDVMILTGAGQIGMAIAGIMNNAGFDVDPMEMDLSSRDSILKLIANAKEYGEISMLVNAAGVSPSQSGHRMPALSAKADEQLAVTPTEELLALDILKPENIRDTLHAYQIAKRCNEKRVMAEAVKWGEKSARINSISPGIIVTPLAIDEFNGPRGDFYKNMFAKCPAGRPGTADEVANVAELLMSEKGAFITGADFLIDGGATASYFYGPLKPEE